MAHRLGDFAAHQIYWFIFVYFCAQLCEFILNKFKWHRDQSILHQRNFVTYVLETIISIPILIALLYYGMNILKGDGFTIEDVDGIIFFSSLFVSLYLFELAYKIRFGIPLLVHHLVTFTLLILAFWSFETITNPNKIKIIKCAILLALTAVTEQMTFIALMMYRLRSYEGKLPKLLERWMEPKRVAWVFYISAISTFLIKTALISISIEPWITLNEFFWWIAYPPLLLGLYIAQVWGAWILIALGKRVSKESNVDIEEAKEKTESFVETFLDYSLYIAGADGPFSYYDAYESKTAFPKINKEPSFRSFSTLNFNLEEIRPKKHPKPLAESQVELVQSNESNLNESNETTNINQ